MSTLHGGWEQVKPSCHVSVQRLDNRSTSSDSSKGSGVYLPWRVSVVVDGDCLNGGRCHDPVAVGARERGHEGIGHPVAVFLKVRGSVASPEASGTKIMHHTRMYAGSLGLGMLVYARPGKEVEAGSALFDKNDPFIRMYHLQGCASHRKYTYVCIWMYLMFPKASLATTRNVAGSPTTAADRPVSPASSSAVQLGV